MLIVERMYLLLAQRALCKNGPQVPSTHLAWCITSNDHPQQIHYPQTLDIFRVSLIIGFVQTEPYKSHRIRVHDENLSITQRTPHSSPYVSCLPVFTTWKCRLEDNRVIILRKISGKLYLHISWSLHGLVSRTSLSISKSEDGVFITQPQKPFRMSLPLSALPAAPIPWSNPNWALLIRIHVPE